MITYYISGLEYESALDSRPIRSLIKCNIRQRAVNQDTGEFEQTQGQAFTLERMMPVPYKLRVTVDFWTTNYQQKLELIEQLGVHCLIRH
jgi:hypothetical protein